MRKRICIVCGEDLVAKEVEMCELCISDNPTLNIGEVNVNNSIRREVAKDRRKGTKKRFNDEE